MITCSSVSDKRVIDGSTLRNHAGAKGIYLRGESPGYDPAGREREQAWAYAILLIAKGGFGISSKYIARLSNLAIWLPATFYFLEIC